MDNKEPIIKSRKKKHPEFDEYYTKLSDTKKPCQNVLDSVREAAMLDINIWESRRKGKNQSPGRPTNEGPSHTDDHRVMALQSSSGAAALTSTKPYNDEDTAASMRRAIHKWFYFNRIPYSHFAAAEIHQLCEAIVASNRISSTYVRPPLALIDEKDILTDLENEIDDYVQTVTGSWNSTRGCTICLETILREFDYVLVAIARCNQGTIFLKEHIDYIEYDLESDEEEAKCKEFLESIIQDVGLDNIKQLLLAPYDDLFMQFNYSTNIENLFSRDLVGSLRSAYKDIFLIADLMFYHYACFIILLFYCCVEGLARLREQCNGDIFFLLHACNRGILCDDPTNVALVLSMMLKEKQKIDGLLGEMRESTITKLSFWNSQKTYDDACRIINLIYVYNNRQRSARIPYIR